MTTTIETTPRTLTETLRARGREHIAELHAAALRAAAVNAQGWVEFSDEPCDASDDSAGDDIHADEIRTQLGREATDAEYAAMWPMYRGALLCETARLLALRENDSAWRGEAADRALP